MNWPEHMSLHITHNSHKDSYEKIEDYIQWPNIKNDILEEDKKEILKHDSIWEVQWYPSTPIGFYYVAAASLERCLELIEKHEMGASCTN